jgi:hypothetical protein
MYEKTQQIEAEKIMRITTDGASLNYYHKTFPSVYYI